MNKLSNFVLISIPFLAIHGLEEYIGKFYNTDPYFRFVASFIPLSNEMTFIISEVLLFLILIEMYRWLRLKKHTKAISILIGIIFVLEVSHILDYISMGVYVPGLITSFPLLILGVLYWKKLLFKEVVR